MHYSINPKCNRLESEIKTIERRIRDVKMYLGEVSPSMISNYQDMIRSRQDLIDLLKNQAAIEEGHSQGTGSDDQADVYH